VIYSYNKKQRDALISEICFWKVSLSIARSLALHTQQQVHVQAVSISCMTNTCCCVYSATLLTMDRETVRNV